LLPKRDGVPEDAVSERTTNSKALESTSLNATEAPDPWSVESRPRPPLSPRRFLPLGDAADPWSLEPPPQPPLSPRRFPPRPLPPTVEADPWSVEPRPLTSPFAKMPNCFGADSEALGEEWNSARRAARYRVGGQ
jgi:hypothetical protein